MTLFRWVLGALLTLLALASAIHAYGIYANHGLWLGSMTVGLLAVMDVGGFLSLALARRRLATEMAALQQAAPGGSLLEARRTTLAAIKRRGIEPNLEVLRDATAAQQMGQAYLGKYLVAVTVLVGLVGTFAGLMETLRTVAPLLQDEKVSALQLVAAPLAGLDVTFGASIVAILVTLALSLVQGDLILAEDATLAALEDATVHVVMPELFPAGEHPGDRAANEVALLRKELGALVGSMADAAAQKVGATAEQHVKTLVQEVRASLTGAVQDSAREVRGGMLDMAKAVEERLTPVLAEERERSEAGRKALTTAADASRKALEEAALALTDSMEKLQATTSTALGNAADKTASSHTRLADATQSLGKTLEAALEAAGTETQEAFKALLADQAAQLGKIADNVGASSRAAVEASSTFGKALEASVEAARNNTANAFEALVEKQGVQLERIAQEVGASSRAAVEASSTFGKALEASVEAARNNTSTAFETLLVKQGTQLERIAQEVGASSRAAVEASSTFGKALEASVEAARNNTSTAFEALVENQAAQLGRISDGVAQASKAAVEASSLAAETATGLQEKLLAEARNQTRVLTVAMGSAAEKTEESFRTLAAAQSQQLSAASQSVADSGAQVLAAVQERITAALAGQQEVVAALHQEATSMLGSLQASHTSTQGVFGKLLEEHAARLKALTQDVSNATNGIAHSMQESAGKIETVLNSAAAKAASLQTETLAELQSQTARITSSQEAAVTRTDAALTALATTHVEHMQLASDTLREAAEGVVKELSGKVSGVSKALDAALAGTLETQQRMMEETRAHVEALTSTADGAANATGDALNRLFAEHAARLSDTTQALLKSIEANASQGQNVLQDAGAALAAAAAAIKDGAAQLGPAVSTLVPELGALSREVALLAARADAPAENEAVVEELSRMAEEMGRLQALLRVGKDAAGVEG